jgi:uncharacterized membrane protein
MRDVARRSLVPAILAAAAGLAAFLCFLASWRYAIFRDDVDLGIFTQVIASTGRGFSSMAEGGVDHLAVHWSPIIVLTWPMLRAFGPVGLQYAQVVLIVATLIPLWGIARARFAQPAACALLAVCAVYPLLWANAVGDFHEMAFVPVLSATLVYAIDRRRFWLGIAAALLLACTKEDQFVALAWIGVILVVTMRRDREVRRFGLWLLAIGIAGALLYWGVIRPAIAPHVPYGSLVEFFDWRGTASINLATLLIPRLGFALFVLAPLAFLPLVSRYGLFLVPGFVEILVSHQPVTLAPGAHYAALLTAYALVAFVDGVSRVAQWRRGVAVAGAALAAVIAAYTQIWNSPMEYWYYFYRLPDRHDALLQETLDTLPPDAEVGSEDEIFAHLGLDPHASIDMNGQQWFVYDDAHYSVRWATIDRPVVLRLLADGTYRVLRNRAGIVVLRRSAGLPRIGPPRKS